MQQRSSGREDRVTLHSLNAGPTQLCAIPSEDSAPAGLLCLQSVFEWHAQHRPGAVSVEFEGSSLTYGELNDRANAVASVLVERGVRPEAVVAVCVERSLVLLPALLGVIKSGAAYVPIDPGLPPERVLFMLRDSGASILLADAAQIERIGKVPVRTLGLEDVLTRVVPESSNPAIALDGKNLAYVIYTSGSTGTPKGVDVEHGALLRALEAIRDELQFSSAGVMLAMSSVSFDISGVELYVPLLAGGKVVIVPRQAAMEGGRLRNLIESTGATVVLGTPASYQMLLDAGWPGNPRVQAICGGEALTPELGRALAQKTKAIWNHYGPTETTIVATTYRVTGNEEKIPIGRPRKDIDLVVLDENERPVKPGTPGELYVGGPAVSRGYRNRPDLTAARFVQFEDSDLQGRYYKTGDLVRQLPNGDYEFIGRLDNQVKLRGYRIELEEIESVLEQHPAVQMNAVLLRGIEMGERRLVAFYSLKSGATVEVPELRAAMQRKLPIYMVPTRFVAMDHLPVTINGKIDRQQLQTIQLPPWHEEPVAVQPADEIEAELLSIWRSTMETQAIRLEDNFFEIGGHSLLAAAVFEQIQKRFSVQLPLSTLFEAPTIKLLASRIRDRKESSGWTPLVAVQEKGSRTPFFCVHPIGGNVLAFWGISTHLGPDQPFYAFQARGLDGVEAPHLSIDEMAEDYLVYMLQAQPQGPYRVGGYSAGGIVAFEIARKLRQLGHQVELLALFDCYIDTRSQALPATKRTRRSLQRLVNSTVARYHHFRAMSASEWVAALQRNASYYLGQWTTEMKTAWYRFASKAGLPKPALRQVQDTFTYALKGYQPQYFDGTAVMFRAERSDGDHDPDPNMGWGRFVRTLELRVVRGDHFSMFMEPYVQGLAAELDRYLASPAAQPEETLPHTQ